MTEAEAVTQKKLLGAVIEGAKKELRVAAGDLTTIRYRLQGVRASLPPSAQETSRGDLVGDPDVTTQMRAAVNGGIQDCLDPLIEDLLAAAEYRPVERVAANNHDSPSTAHLDLSAYSEATQRALYDLVVAEYFGQILEPSDAEWGPPYTPQEAGLAVVYTWGRWFASWLRLDLPGGLPEAERRKTIVMEEDPDRPCTLRFRDV